MSCTYDGAGNPTGFFNVGDLSTWTMTWKNGRELAAAGNGTHSVSYDYDVNSLRTYKIVDGVRHNYTYASGQLLRETYTQGGISYKLDFLYDQSGRPYMLYLTKTTSSGTTSAPYYYILNLQGDVLYLVNTSGVAVASYTYDPYGSILSSTGSLANVNPLRYRGYYYDGETGFYYLQSRYYDPTLGRFLNADSYASTGQGFLGYNMFAYCENNPVKYIDSFGNFAWIPGAVGAITSFVTTLVCGGDLGDAFKAAFWGGVFAYAPEEIVHIANGLVAAYETWVNGGSFSDVLGSGMLNFLTSYVSGSTLLSSSGASEAVIAAFDLTFGFEAKLGGNALSEGFFGSDETVNSPFSNNSYGGLQDHMPANSHFGGGGGYGNTWHLVLY